MRARGLFELERHFQHDCLFRADQRFREKNCPGKIRGRDGKVLYGSRLEAYRECYMELDVPDLDFKRPFCHDMLERKRFTFTTEESRVRIHINLLMRCLKNGGQLWALEAYWTQVLQLDILHQLLKSIAVKLTFLLVIFGVSSGLCCNCSVFILWAIYGHWDYCLSDIFVLVGNKTEVVPLF